MRTREEIEKEMKAILTFEKSEGRNYWPLGNQMEAYRVQNEVLLDIRETLVTIKERYDDKGTKAAN